MRPSVDVPADPLGADLDEGVSDRIRARLPRIDAGRFSLLLIDRESGRAKRVRFDAVTLENILRADVKFVSPLAGALRDAVLTAAKELWPELQPYRPPKRLEPQPRREFDPEISDRYDSQGRFIARWRRRRGDAQALTEYAVILALVVIVAVIALVFIGGQVSTALQDIGESI